jgi:hypothetical protein
MVVAGPPGFGEGTGVSASGTDERVVMVRCVLEAVSSALEATAAAGFRYEFVPKQIGFVCQIDGYPDPCNGAPGDAYWSLWIAQNAQWTYSTTGSATLPTPTDAIVAWSFGAGEEPSLAVPSLDSAAEVAKSGPAQPAASDLGDRTASADSLDGDSGRSGESSSDAGNDAGIAGRIDSGPAGTIIAAALVIIAGLVTWLAAKRGRGRG